MTRNPLRRAAPRPATAVLARPRPTAASALLVAVLLSVPFAALALLQALF
ncbi:hypothetical protein [Antarctobacter sp.]|nr:hypothetical protein [Antarctobacter sp.]